MAYRLQEEGNEVYFYSKMKDPGHAGMLRHIVPDWRKYADAADLIINDDVIGIQKPESELFALGKPVVSGNSFFNRLENDRLFGKDIFKKIGLTISDCVHFTDLKEAAQFIKKNPAKWVFKANGQASRTLGYVGKKDDGSDVIERMAFYENRMKDDKLWDKKLGVDFVLEKCVDGIEVACGAYWDGQDFVGLNINWEHKKLGVGNVGVATGEMGTAIRAFRPETNFYMGTLAKLKPLLKQFPYRTYVDLNCIVNKDNAYILEVTARLGYPIETALNSMCSLTASQRYMLLGSGMLHKVGNKFFKDNYGIAMTLGTFGFPYEVAYEEFGAGQPCKFPNSVKKNLYLDGVDKVKNHYETAKKGEGWVFTATGSGSSISSSQDKTHKVIESVDLPGMYYREDIGDRADADWKQLKKWGYVS